MTGYREQVAEALQAIRLHPPLSHSWFGALSEVRLKRFPGPPPASRVLRFAIAMRLYSDFYRTGRAVPGTRRAVTAGLSPGAHALRGRLIEALGAERVPWPGWYLVSRSQSRIVGEHQGLRIAIERGEPWYPAGRSLAPGDPLPLDRPRVRERVSPGYVTLVGRHSPRGGEHLSRIYLNLTAVAAPHLAAALGARLDDAELPYEFKVASDPDEYWRTDVAVLYVDRDDAERATEITLEVAREPGTLDPEVPALTRPLAPGLALADDPGDGESFGLHRCHLLAAGIVEAHARGVTELVGRLAVVESALATAGVSLLRPYCGDASR